MSRLEDLIQTLCPDGVEYKKVGQVCKFVKGNGLSKDSKGLGDVPIILYGELYTTYGDYITEVFSHTSEDLINSSPTIHKGDLLLPISSTTKEAQIGKASVYLVDEPAYLGGDAILLRTEQNPGYLLYLLNGNWFEKHKMKCVFGTTINHLHPSKLSNIDIPIPPLPVQEEIVRILDTFSGVVAELEAEQAARVRQYEHYRNELLSFDRKSKIIENLFVNFSSEGVNYVKLREIAPPTRGVRVVRSQLALEGGYPVYQNSMTPLGYFEEQNCPAKTAFIISAGAAGEVGYSMEAFWAADDCFYFICPQQLSSRFLYYLLKAQQGFLLSRVRRASVPRLARSVIEGLKIPVLPLEIQERIVSILDRFEILVNDLKSGLPAEITLRRKQYEYYRDKLLTFPAKQPPL